MLQRRQNMVKEQSTDMTIEVTGNETLHFLIESSGICEIVYRLKQSGYITNT